MDGSQNSQIQQSLGAELFSPLPKSRQLFTYLMNGIAWGLTILAVVPLLSILLI